MSGWENVVITVGPAVYIHIIPVGDIKRHTMTHSQKLICNCGPSLEWQMVNRCMVSHHAWDGREETENDPR